MDRRKMWNLSDFFFFYQTWQHFRGDFWIFDRFHAHVGANVLGAKRPVLMKACCHRQTRVWLSLGLFVSLLMHNCPWPYTGMCIWEWWGENLILGPRDSGHSEPRGHKKTFLLSVVPIVRHKHCFLQSVTRTLQNAYAPDDTTGAPLVSLEGRRKEEKGGTY